MLKFFAVLVLVCLSFGGCGHLETVVWEGTRTYNVTNTENYSGKKLIIKDSTILNISDVTQDGEPVDLTVVADEIVIEGKIKLIGQSESGKDGANIGKDCDRCIQEGRVWETHNWNDFVNAKNQDPKPSYDLGKRGDDGGNGIRGSIVTFRSKKISGQERIDYSQLIGGSGGKGKKGGANRLYFFRDPNDSNHQEYGLGGDGPSGTDGKPGLPGKFSWEGK